MASKPEIGAHQSGKTHHSQAHDRSHGHTTAPKKGGAGGHNWGRPGDELDLAAADVARELAERSDDDVSLREVAVPLDTIAIESVVEPAVKEYFDSADLNEAGASIQRFRYGTHAHKIVTTAVLLSLDRTNAERELCSRLVSRLRDMRIVSAGDMEKAFSEILVQIPDLKLDTPEVCDLVGRFLARAVADDCLAPAYVTEHRALSGDFSALAKDAVEKARTLLVIPFAHTRLDLVWGHNGSIEPLESVVESIKTLVAEYLASADVAEAERCLRELAAPHFHHELVFEAILAVLDTDTAKHASNATELVVRLLSHTVAAGFVTPNQLETGIARVTDSLDDIKVDDPHAPEYLERLYALMAADKALAEARALVTSVGTA